MDKIKVGIIGCGKVAHFHARGYLANENCELTAAYNVRIGRANEFAAVYGIKPFDSIERMVREAGVEAVSVCTPHPAHREPALEAINLGLHVAVEKPLAVSLADCDAIISAAKRMGVKGTTVSQRRFYPPVKRVYDAIKEGKIGCPVLGIVTMLGWRDEDYYKSDPWRGTWEGEGGGVLVNQAAHQLDLLLWYMGEIDELYGIWDTLNHPFLEVDDTAVAVIRFKNGGIGNIVVSNSQNPALYGKVHVHGENGASIGVQTDGGAMFIAGVTGITEPPYNDIWTIPGEESLLEEWKLSDERLFTEPDSIYRFHEIQLRDFINAVMTGSEPSVTLEDGRRTAELFNAIYRSNREKKVIRFPLKSDG